MVGNRAARMAFVLIVVIVLGMIARNFYRRYLNRALIQAVRNGQAAAVRSLLNRGADPNYVEPPSGEGWLSETALDLAFSQLYVSAATVNKATNSPPVLSSQDVDEIVCLLIRKGARISKGDYLVRACSLGDISILTCLLDHGADPNARDNLSALNAALDYGNLIETALFNAPEASEGIRGSEAARRQAVSRRMVRLLCDHGAHLALIQAQMIADKATVRKILEGSVPGLNQEEGYLALNWAAGHGDLEMVRRLLKRGIDPNNAPPPGQVAAAFSGFALDTPLHAAAQSDHLEAVRLLLEYRADPNRARAYAETPLTAAARTGDLELAKLLTAHGARANEAGGYSPLDAAVNRGSAAFVRYLLARGADPRSSLDRGARLLTAALKQPKIQPLVPELIRLGAEVNVTIAQSNSQINGQRVSSISSERAPVTPLMAAVWYAPEYEPMLLKAGAKIGPDRTIICLAAVKRRRLSLLPKLIASGADIDGMDMYHETALTYCIDHTPSDVKALFEHGMHPKVDMGYGRSPLVRAVLTGNAATVRLLLAHGAAINAHAPVGHTALYWARKKNYPDIVALLQQAGARE